MKIFLFFLLALPGTCKAQEWQAEIMAALRDTMEILLSNEFRLKQLRPAAQFKFKI